MRVVAEVADGILKTISGLWNVLPEQNKPESGVKWIEMEEIISDQLKIEPLSEEEIDAFVKKILIETPPDSEETGQVEDALMSEEEFLRFLDKPVEIPESKKEELKRQAERERADRSERERIALEDFRALDRPIVTSEMIAAFDETKSRQNLAELLEELERLSAELRKRYCG